MYRCLFGPSGPAGHPRETPPVRPIRYGRIGGALYLVIVAGIVGPLLTRDRLIVPQDPAATAHNIAASPELWRLAIAVDVVMQLCDVPVMLILFLLLSPVNRNVALLVLCLLDGSFGPLLSAFAAALRQSGRDGCEEALQGSNATANLAGSGSG
jgi:hypothetical protein